VKIAFAGWPDRHLGGVRCGNPGGLGFSCDGKRVVRTLQQNSFVISMMG